MDALADRIPFTFVQLSYTAERRNVGLIHTDERRRMTCVSDVMRRTANSSKGRVHADITLLWVYRQAKVMLLSRLYVVTILNLAVINRI